MLHRQGNAAHAGRPRSRPGLPGATGSRQLHAAMVARLPASTLWAWRPPPAAASSSRSDIPGLDQYAGLETFENPGVADVELVSDELTAVCPITGQPDLYRVTIGYKPAGPVPRVEVAEAVPQRLQERRGVLRGARSPDPRRDRRGARAARRGRANRARAEGPRRDHDHRPCLAHRACLEVDPFDDVSLELLRLRRSAKWAKYPRTCFRPGSPRWISRSRCRSVRRFSRRSRATTRVTPTRAGSGSRSRASPPDGSDGTSTRSGSGSSRMSMSGVASSCGPSPSPGTAWS